MLTWTRYIQFHPLAYTVKLNIEMAMANLIKRIAISSSRKTGNAALAEEFASDDLSTSGAKSSGHTRKHTRRSSLIELSSNVFATKSFHDPQGRTVSFAPTGNQIKVTQDLYVRSEPNPEYARRDMDGPMGMGELKAGQGTVIKSKSMDDITEGGESVKSEYGQGKGDSDDEQALVIQGGSKGWGRLKG